MFDHLNKMYELKSDNEYRKSRGLADKKLYNSKKRTEAYARRKAGIRSDDVENVIIEDDDWVDC